MKTLPTDYNKSPNSIRHSWPLRFDGTDIESQLLFHILNQDWISLDMHYMHSDRVPNALGLYIIVGTLDKFFDKLNFTKKDNFISNNLNCVLYVGKGNLKDRYKTHIVNPHSIKIKKAIEIYNPKYYYIKTQDIKINYLEKIDRENKTEALESILISFFGPTANDNSGKDINTISSFDNDKNISYTL